MKNVFLITKLKTSNLGNEALSSEIIRLFSEIAGDNKLHVNGRPFGLEGYYRNRIASKSDPVKLFEKWADNVAEKIKEEPRKEFESKVPAISLLTEESSSLRFESFKARLRPIKRVLDSFKVYPAKYSKRAQILKSSEWLIYSGAGEVGDNNVFLRQLIELRAAQKLGIKTAAVNQSVVIKTPLFQKLVGHVYGKMQKVVVRGDVTFNNLVQYGVPAGVIEVAPDSAINAAFTQSVKRVPGTVGINITPNCKATSAQLEVIAKYLKSVGKKAFFITNEPFGDAAIMKEFETGFGIQSIKNVSGYKDFMSKLASFEYIISARLHTNILSLDTHTPIIPIEGNVFKTTELLRQLQYPVPTIDPSREGWVDQLTEEINKVENRHYDFQSYFKDVLPGQQQRVKRNAAWLKEI